MSFCEDPRKIYVGGRAVFKGCGKCRLCRSRAARDLAFRFQKDVDCWREYYGYDSDTYFVTLTYDDEHVHVVDDPGNDKVYNYCKDKHFTACKEDIMRYKERIRSQLFRDLKKRVPLMFVSCTEYGDNTNRPHCHFVVHGIPSTYKEGDLEKMSEFFSSKWKDKDGNDIGFVLVKVCNAGTVIYTADYASSGTYVENLPAVCEAPCVQYSKGIGSRYFSRNVDKLKELGGVPCVIKAKGKKQKSVILPYPRYFVRKYIATDKKFKCDNYKRSLKARAIDLTIKYGASHPYGSYDDFANASYRLYSLRRILDKLTRYCAAEDYLSEWPLLEETWSAFGTGKFNQDLILSVPEAKDRHLRDYTDNYPLLSLIKDDAAYAAEHEFPKCFDCDVLCLRDPIEKCRFFLKDVIWCLTHDFVVSTGCHRKLREAYEKLMDRSFDEFVRKYWSYIELFEKEYKFGCDASVQKLYDMKSKKKGVL